MPPKQKKTKIKQHPFYPKPDPQLCIKKAGSREGGEKLWGELIAKRNQLITAEENNKLQLGSEPGIWKVADALLGLPCFDQQFEERLQKEAGIEWDEFCRRIREMHGFKEPLTVLLILGCNRSSKTEYAAKRTIQVLSQHEKEMSWIFSQTAETSNDIVQPAIWDYFPPGQKEGRKTKGQYVNYSVQNRFTNNSFVLPNLAKGKFKNYSQSIDSLEGAEPVWIWADEEIPVDFQDTLEGRLPSAFGQMLDTFTPINGWTPVVNIFQTSSKTMRENDAFLLPTDGGEPDPMREFGFENEKQMERARFTDSRATRPEDPIKWITGERSRPEAPKGRKFEKMPRIRKCLEEEKGILWFHASDNPFGNPPGIWNKWKYSTREKIRQRMYGFASKMISNQLASFSRDIHVIPDDKIPEEGTNYMCIDPTPGGRPYFITWLRCGRFGKYIYREFPQINPSQGIDDVPWGRWAEPSGRNGGINDGKPGQGAEPLMQGWGVKRHLQEILRLEGIKNWREFKDSIDDVDWQGGEDIFERYIDSRAASAPRQVNDIVTTLLEMFGDYGMILREAPGNKVDDRVQFINNALAYDKNGEGEIVTPPTLYIAESCENSIFAAENWMNADGGKGATKDPIDNIGYMISAECDHVEDGSWETEGGGAR